MENKSVRELVETMKKMRQKGYETYLKGGRGKVRPIYEDRKMKGGNK